VIYIGSASGNLYALKVSSGAVLWSAAMSGQVISSPAVDIANKLLVVGDSAGDVTAFATSGTDAGTMVWTHKTGGAVDDTPIISGGEVYVGSDDGNEYALSESSGAVKWSMSLGGDPSATASLMGTQLFVGTGSDEIYALSTSNGATKWKWDTGSAVTGVSSTTGFVFIENADGTLIGYRTGSGQQDWLAQAGSSLSGTPVPSDNAVLIGAGNGSLYIDTPFGYPMV
jgi:outer membrane protein assembly factor BamB